MRFANPRVSGNIPFPMDASLTAPGVAQKSWTLWAGWILSALVSLLMLFSAFMKFRQPPEVVKGFADMGVRPGMIGVIGIMELASVVLYLMRPTAVLGAVLVAGYLGGAVFAHISAQQLDRAPVPFIVGVIAWLGLYLREPRVRALFPLTRTRV